MPRLLLLAAAVALATTAAAQRVTLTETQTVAASDADGGPLDQAFVLTGPDTQDGADAGPFLYVAGFGGPVGAYVRRSDGTLALAGTYDAPDDALDNVSDAAVIEGGSAHFTLYREAGGVAYASARSVGVDIGTGQEFFEISGGMSNITTDPFPQAIAFGADGTMAIASRGLSGSAPRRLQTFSLADNPGGGGQSWARNGSADLSGPDRRTIELLPVGYGFFALAENALLSDPDSAIISVHRRQGGEGALVRVDSLKRGDVPGLDRVFAAAYSPAHEALYVGGFEDDPNGDGDTSDGSLALVVIGVEDDGLAHRSTLITASAIGPSFREIQSMALSPDGQTLLVGGSDTNEGEAFHHFASDGDALTPIGSDAGPADRSNARAVRFWPGGGSVYALDLTTEPTLRAYSYAFTGVSNEAAPEPGAALRVWPNPAAGAATVEVALAAPGAVRVTVHDVLGREVAELWDGPSGAGPLRLDVEAGRLAPGRYLVRALGSGGSAALPLTVAR